VNKNAETGFKPVSKVSNNLKFKAMETKNESLGFSHEDGLKTIYAMITSTKNTIGENYLFYLLWGYLVGLACISEYILIRVVNYERHYMVWPVLMGLGMVVSGVLTLRRQKASTHRTFIGNIMSYLWGGWLVSFMIIMYFSTQLQNHSLIMPLTMVMYGMGIFISGGIISYRPLIIGGIISWIAALVAYFQPYNVQLLLMTATVIVSYIIPGHMLRIEAKKQKS
jgi:hypothetical protein